MFKLKGLRTSLLFGTSKVEDYFHNPKFISTYLHAKLLSRTHAYTHGVTINISLVIWKLNIKRFTQVHIAQHLLKVTEVSAS